MKSLMFGCLLLFSPFLWSGSTDASKEFVKNLSSEQKVLLNEFLTTITESSAGYVIHGDKPMSIETYDLASVRKIPKPDRKIVSLLKGNEMWQDLSLTSNKQFLLTLFEKDSLCHVVCVNRKAFVNTVDDNIALFRYVLGPAVTAEGLLVELVEAKGNFYDVLKSDRVLTEILLGNGKQNALVHSRLEQIVDPYTFGGQEEFPIISKKLCRSWSPLSEKYRKAPSFSFNSITDEELALRNLTVNSGKIKPFNGLEIPHFSCEPNTDETKAILSSYESVRNKILRSMKSKSFLEDTMRKFFTSNTGALEESEVPPQKDLYLPTNKVELTQKLAGLIRQRIATEPYGVKKFQVAFMQGVIAREKGKQTPVPYQMKRFNDIDKLKLDLECCKSLEQANAYFARLATREDLVALIHNEVFYKTLKPGKGPAASSKLNKVSFQYSYQILGENQTKDLGIIKNENLSALIPGVAHALVGMQQGEERVVYIHPKYGYGENTFYPPNASIVAQIRLLDFQEADKAVSILPPHQIEAREYRDLLAKFEVLRGEEYFDEGVEFWDAVKKGGNFIDFATFQKLYSASEKNESLFLDVNQEDKFVVDLQYQLFILDNASKSN